MFSTSNILDTLRLDSTGFFLKDLHAERTFETYQILGLKTDLNSILRIYDQVEEKLIKNFLKPQKVRLIFNEATLDYHVQTEKLDAMLNNPIRLQLTTMATQKAGIGAGNYKWEDRSYWTQLLSQKHDKIDDIISMNTNNEVTETSRFNIFIYSPDHDAVYTPNLESGCINGVYRRFVFQTQKIDLPSLGRKSVYEKTLTASDLKQATIFVANSVRGVIRATLI